MAKNLGLIFVFAAMLCPVSANASADLELDKCVSLKGRSEVKACLAEVELQSEKDLDAATSRASLGADSRHTDLLNKATDAFRRYREAECSFEGVTMRGGFGAEDQADECSVSHNRQRVDELNNATALTGH